MQLHVEFSKQNLQLTYYSFISYMYTSTMVHMIVILTLFQIICEEFSFESFALIMLNNICLWIYCSRVYAIKIIYGLNLGGICYIAFNSMDIIVLGFLGI